MVTAADDGAYPEPDERVRTTAREVIAVDQFLARRSIPRSRRCSSA